MLPLPVDRKLYVEWQGLRSSRRIVTLAPRALRSKSSTASILGHIEYEARRHDLGQAGMQYPTTWESYRGLYWYPPGGFTEWHTDGAQVQGWRVYMTLVSQENTSAFVYRSFFSLSLSYTSAFSLSLSNTHSLCYTSAFVYRSSVSLSLTRQHSLSLSPPYTHSPSLTLEHL